MKALIQFAVLLLMVTTVFAQSAGDPGLVMCNGAIAPFTTTTTYGRITWTGTPDFICSVFYQAGGGTQAGNWIAYTIIGPTKVFYAQAAIASVLDDMAAADPVLFQQSMQAHQLTLAAAPLQAQMRIDQ